MKVKFFVTSSDISDVKKLLTLSNVLKSNYVCIHLRTKSDYSLVMHTTDDAIASGNWKQRAALASLAANSIGMIRDSGDEFEK